MLFHQVKCLVKRINPKRGLHLCRITFARTHYDVLGVKKDASKAEVKAAFIRKSKQYHPDKNRESTTAHDEMMRVNQAYSILKDRDARQQYDMYLAQAQPEYNFKDWESTVDKGIKSPFMDTSQEYYRYPNYYTDPLLRHEAEKVWDHYLRLQMMKSAKYNRSSKESRNSVFIGVAFLLFLSGLFMALVMRYTDQMIPTKNREVDARRRRERQKKNMPSDVTFDEQAGHFRKKRPGEMQQEVPLMYINDTKTSTEKADDAIDLTGK